MTTARIFTSVQPLKSYEPARPVEKNPSALIDGASGDIGEKPQAHYIRLNETPSPSTSEPDPIQRHLRMMLIAILEARAGIRSPAQLKKFLHPYAYRKLSIECQTPDKHYLLGSILLCRPTAEVVEAAGTARAEGRTVALTARLEYIRDFWLCTTYAVLRGSGK